MAEEGRLFKPLADTKAFAMAAAALLSITLVPALMILFVRGRIIPEGRNPVNRFLIWIYRPIIGGVESQNLDHRHSLALLAATGFPATRIGAEFMPSLNEGKLFYMPTTLPGISITRATELLQIMNRILKSFPRVLSVFGRSAAPARPPSAPTEMFETIINLKDPSEWREGMTLNKLIQEMDRALQFPGVSNAWNADQGACSVDQPSQLLICPPAGVHSMAGSTSQAD